MELTIGTPALLFSAISLFFLAFTNRFLALAQLIRNLHNDYKNSPSVNLQKQITNIRLRLNLIRYMQIAGMTSMLLCVICMCFIFFKITILANICFGLALALMMASLTLSIWEIQISVDALNTHLSDMENKKDNF